MKTLIKICGLRDPDIAKRAVEMGAHYIGIMFYSLSKRYVEPALGREIAEATQQAGGIPVAVFVDQNAEQMISICETIGVDTVQLAGAVARQNGARLRFNYRRIYVLHVSEDGMIQPDFDRGLTKLNFKRDYVMYDGLQSGSGRSFNLKQLHHAPPGPFFLAGGLTQDNVTEALRVVNPDVIDVSSGVESSAGVKDINKIKAFIEAVRGNQNER